MTKAKNTFFTGTLTAIVVGTLFMSGHVAAEPSAARSKSGSSAAPDAVVKAEKLHRSANMTYKVAGKRYYPLKEVSSFSQTGNASWYGPGFHGRKTSNGERFDMNMMTAAHPTLPIPSYARVTNLANGKQVVVRINDRGPFHGKRVLDVSKAAAQKLGFIHTGMAKVRIEQIVPGQQQAAKNIYVNLQRFDNEAAARSYLTKTSSHLNSANSTQRAEMVQENGSFVVRMGPFTRQENANAMQKQVQTAI